MLRDVISGFIKLHILYHASREPVFGLDLIQELHRHGYELSPGTLYPTLHALEEEGYLRHEDKIVNGRRRKYYTATRQGRAALNEVRSKVQELVGEILED
jgi:DNA-binding PadR family transcriptional regulator